MKLAANFCVAVVFFTNGIVFADSPKPLKALSRMPIQEITVFKDGHAFVLHSGKMPVGAKGDVVMDYLPNPVLGAFWPFSKDKKAKLESVTASSQKVLADRTAISLKELIEANIGAEVIVAETAAPANQTYHAKILEIPAQEGAELEALDVPNSGEKLRQRGDVVVLKTENGAKIVKLDGIRDISFLGNYQKMLQREEFRNMLTLSLDWLGNKPQTEAEVGLLYLQRGLRWIPNYRVTLDGKGQASIKLQATLINELADFSDSTIHLVIGAPNFEFKETTDPIGLQKTVAQLSSYFQQDSRNMSQNLLSNNVVMSQSQMPARMNEPYLTASPDSGSRVDLGPNVANANKAEDLFVFTIKHVSLRKGQRMVFSVNEFSLKYKDVYSLEIPFAPPFDVWRRFDSNRQAEIARMLNAPKMMHKIRLMNSSAFPTTTAPALLLEGDQILSQTMMTYASPGSSVDLDITAALDIRIKKSENETGRIPNEVTWQGSQFGRIDLSGKITLTNYLKNPVEVEVVRHVMGNPENASNGGKIEMVNIFEDPSFTSRDGALPYWWSWYSWPYWWSHFNSIGRINWSVILQPNTPVDLVYTWNYYWN
jgi:hypothetical protein